MIPAHIIEKAVEGGCLRCGAEKQDKMDKYCSPDCWYATIRKPRPECLICGQSVKKRENKLCSVSCSNRWKYRDKRNHPSWRGGKRYWLIHARNRLWRPMAQWRAKVLERDNYTCQMCKATDVDLQADHIKPFRYFPELALDISNGRTLCVPCHKTTPTYGRKGDKLSRNLILTGGDTDAFWEELYPSKK